jgi:ATP-dependent DNA helicase RecG
VGNKLPTLPGYRPIKAGAFFEMTISDWADSELTNDLPRLLRVGETQEVEFKEKLPKQSTDFACEIAAFAGTNNGMILLGVSDSGVIVGVEGAQSQNVRDDLISRIVGICQSIKPSIKPVFIWAESERGIVLGIKVVRGTAPLYYVRSRPYLRHASSSRPAEPDEVIKAVKEYLAKESLGSSATDSESAAASGLANMLVTTMRWCDVDIRLRSLKPWLDDRTFFAKHTASSLRELAADEFALKNDLVEQLKNIANALDSVPNFTHAFGRGGDFEETCAHARKAAQSLFDTFVRPIPLSNKSTLETKSTILKTIRLLIDEWDRAERAPFSGAVEGAQTQSGIYGRRLMDLSYYPLDFLSEPAALKLRKLGSDFILLETQTMYGDGGASQRQALTTAKSSLNQLNGITAILSAE